MEGDRHPLQPDGDDDVVTPAAGDRPAQNDAGCAYHDLWVSFICK